MNSSLGSIFRELTSSLTGRTGITFLLVMFAISAYALITNPLDFGTKFWNNPAVWADNPKNAPPTWVNIFSSSQKMNHAIFESHTGTKQQENYYFTMDYKAEESPTFSSLSIQGISYTSRPPTISLSVTRPDGEKINLYHHVAPAPRTGETSPIKRYTESPFRIYLTGNAKTANNIADLLSENSGNPISSKEILGKVDRVIFSEFPASLDGEFKPLKGKYTFALKSHFNNPNDYIRSVKLVLGGSSYGIMGTDSVGRDLAKGLLFGFPVALAIGLITSIFATAIGTTAGIISGYTAGKTDIFIQRFSDVLTNIPLLPILLFLAFVLGQKLWIVMVVLIIFGWPGLSIVVRSIVLQIRTGQLVEASVALGASRWRIMAHHIFPQISPFIFAQMIFFTPAAILAEAGLSFLGLGDTSIPTWGQILDQGFRTGAVYIGYWWWVIPPGILIVMTALTFVLIALGMEKVVDPRLRNTST